MSTNQFLSMGTGTGPEISTRKCRVQVLRVPNMGLSQTVRVFRHRRVFVKDASDF